MVAVSHREVNTFILAPRDRLTRLGFDWFEHDANTNRCADLHHRFSISSRSKFHAKRAG
jgi:hypothetical protein